MKGVIQMAAQLLTQLILFLIISSGSVVGSAVLKRNFESFLPVTCMGIISVLFLFGLAGVLWYGVIFILIACLCAYLYVIGGLLKKKLDASAFRNSLFSPGFFVFLFAFIMLTYLNYGRLLSGWDEFSHWGDIVKIMVSIDDFGTAKESGALFKSYPPGMSLFQYFFQKVMFAVNPEAEFCEWQLFFAYQIFFISFLLQFLDGLSFRKIWNVLLAAMLVLLAPMAFFPDCYINIYIDQFVAVAAGAGLAQVFIHKRHDNIYNLNILMSISLLVLCKDAAMLFALCLLAAYLGDNIIRSGKKQTLREIIKNHYKAAVCGICALLIPKLLWSINIHINEAEIKFSENVNIIELLKVITGKDYTYRTVVWQRFWAAFVQESVEFGTLHIPVPYILVFILLIAAVGVVLFAEAKRNPERKGHMRLGLGITAVMLTAYVFGLCIMFMFKFVEHEAVGLSCLNRYICTAFLAVWIFVILLTVDFMRKFNIKLRYLIIFVLCAAAIFVPMRRLGAFVLRNGIDAANSQRQQYQSLIDDVFDSVEEENADILVIAQEGTGFEFVLMHHMLRPFNVSGDWSFGVPFYEGDYWTVNISPEEWHNTVLKNYDYVVTCRINDYFEENFAASFANPEDIKGKAVYRVNSDGLLELVG